MTMIKNVLAIFASVQERIFLHVILLSKLRHIEIKGVRVLRNASKPLAVVVRH